MALGLLPFTTNLSYGNVMKSKNNTFKRMSPESQGVSSAAIAKFIDAANASGIQWHSFMLLRHGNVIAEGWWNPYDPSYKHTLYSLSKSFTSTAIGLLVKDGKIKVEEPVISFFQGDLPAVVSDNLKKMTIKNLLTMNTGHNEDTTPKMRSGPSTWTKTFLSLPVEHEPGSHFLYNTGATYMLGAIVNKVSGQDVEEFLKNRLFIPMGITDYDWEKSPEGLSVAGWGLRLRLEDIAKLGQLYLQKGKWNGTEILTESWVADASSAQTTSNPGDGDWSQGYGYQFWRCKPGFYRGDGAFGQFCIVMPQHDAVLVANAESFDLQKQMVVMWENLLPAMGSGALPENNANTKALQQSLAGLTIPIEKQLATTPVAREKYNNKKFTLAANTFGIEWIQLTLSGSEYLVRYGSSTRNSMLRAGSDKWITDSPWYPFIKLPAPSAVASTAKWVDNNTLQLTMRFVEGAHGDKMTFVFDGNKVSIQFLSSVVENNKRSDERAVLEGTMM